MGKYMVQFTKSVDHPIQTRIVEARDNTDAYLQVYFKLPKDTHICELFEITKEENINV